MSVVVHLEAGSGSKANGGPSEPEGAISVAVTAGDESGSGAATEAEEKRATRRHKRKAQPSKEQRGCTGELVGDRDGRDGFHK